MAREAARPDRCVGDVIDLHLSDVSRSGDVWPVLFQDVEAEGLHLALPDGLHPSPFEAEVEATDASEEGGDRDGGVLAGVPEDLTVLRCHHCLLRCARTVHAFDVHGADDPMLHGCDLPEVPTGGGAIAMHHFSAASLSTQPVYQQGVTVGRRSIGEAGGHGRTHLGQSRTSDLGGGRSG